ncbi:hypothetical protein BaRGS_00029427 [Batillaria attramentaria]|uniref:Uncharacterized protein n=1 Tax=Batillaria attramentaria TaxID=370345 RepID=A0ABD0JX67_9CAEN
MHLTHEGVCRVTLRSAFLKFYFSAEAVGGNTQYTSTDCAHGARSGPVSVRPCRSERSGVVQGRAAGPTPVCDPQIGNLPTPDSVSFATTNTRRTSLDASCLSALAHGAAVVSRAQ